MERGLQAFERAMNGGLVEDAEPRNALELLQDYYKGRRPIDPGRMRAAMAALQFETPRLGVIATTNLGAEDFATLLDKAIERSNGARLAPKALPPPGEPEGDAA
jgi:hypothetical protein